MAHDRRFRFGLQAHGASTGAQWAGLARQVEDLGYSTLFMPDHFGDQLAPVPALMAAAAATTNLRVGTLVLDNDYKHPLVLAKELATIDLLSDGRLEVGLGAGWMASDYAESGIPHDPARVRVDRFEEGLSVIKGLFGPEPFSFEGSHYRITDHNGLPKPVSQGGPPILVGEESNGCCRSLAARPTSSASIPPCPTEPSTLTPPDLALRPKPTGSWPG